MYSSKRQWQYGVCYTSFLLLVTIALLVAHLVIDFQQRHEIASRDAQTIFQRIIGDAAQANIDDISNQLLAVDPNNEILKWQQFGGETRIKVAAWMTRDAYKTRYKELVGNLDGAYTPNKQPVVWVTLVPQVQDFCRAFIAQSGDAKNISAAFRLKQYLGLNPHRSYAQFVELWVKPSDLFRPCPDPEIDDTECQLELDKKNPPEVERVSPNYSTFYKDLITRSYGSNGAPWTRLGYTYDWIYGQRHVGASEYMLAPKAHYLVAASYSTNEYCMPLSL